MNNGGMHQDYTNFSHPHYRGIMEEIVPLYILIVGDRILGVDITPMQLPFEEIPADTSFTVAVGVKNEFGKREIIGTIADYKHIDGATVSRITSPLDGNYRLVGLVDNAPEFIKERLRIMFRSRMITDVACLRTIVVVDGFINEESTRVRVRV